MKRVHVDESIVRVTLPPSSIDGIEAGNVLDVLQPDLVPPDQREALEFVRKLTQDLTPLQQSLLLNGLRHAIDGVHAGRVVFGLMASSYELNGLGLELKDDSITLREGDGVVEDLVGPLRVVFTTSA
jgi:hypothetical protein